MKAARSDKHFTVSERSAVRIQDHINTLFRIVNDHRDASSLTRRPANITAAHAEEIVPVELPELVDRLGR